MDLNSMNFGNLNIKFAWIWLLLFTILGALLEIMLLSETWEADYLLPTRALLRSSHVHALLLSFYNLFYGIMIDGAKLTDRAKRGGSIHAVIGAIVLPLGLFLGAFFQPARYLSPLGGLAIIASTAVMVKGYLGK